MVPAAAPLVDALARPFTDPLSRTWWPGLVVAAVVGVFMWWRSGKLGSATAQLRAMWTPSTRLDVQLYLARQLLTVLGLGGGGTLAYALATRLVLQLDRTVGPVHLEWSPIAVTVLYTAVLFVAWDASRFALHWALHRVPALWGFHQVHHSATVLTPLTFHRIHPVESALYQLRGGLVTGVLAGLFYWLFREHAEPLTLAGVPAVGVLLNVAFGNLRHSHVFVRFPAAVEHWLLSPAQHQLHHSADPAHYDTNFGTWLAVWDRLAGTLLIAEQPPVAFGIQMQHRNHADHLLSAWLGPFAALWPGRRVAGLLVLCALPLTADAQDSQDDDADGEGDDFGSEIIVYAPDKTPRVAGAATRLDEDHLEQFEYDDIGRVLVQVPGVTIRGEDGYGLRPNIGIRGVNSDRSAKVTLMEDGVPLAPAPYAAPAAYYFPMSNRLTGVEVFKGAAATRFGPQTVAGAINLLTRSVPDDGLVWEADLAGGLRQTGRAHVFVGSGSATSGWLVEGIHLQTAGFKELDTGGDTGFGRSELMAKGRWRPSTNHTLALKLGYAREQSNETYVGLSQSDFEATPYRRYASTEAALMQWRRSQAEASWTVAASDDVTIHTVGYHHWLTRAWTKFNRFAGGPDAHALLQQDPTTGQGAVYLDILRGQEDSTSPDQQLLIGTNDRSYHSYGVQSRLRWADVDGQVSHTLEASVRLHADDVWRLHTEDPHNMVSGRLQPSGDPTITNTDSFASARALSASVHEDVVYKGIHLIPGARVEVISTALTDEGSPADTPLTRTVVLPGLGAMWDVSRQLSFFGGAYRGFSPVPPGESASVEPELSWNTEGGLRVVEGDLHAELVGFHNEYQNLTGQCTLSGGCLGDQLDQQFNGGAARVWGVEVSAGHVVLLPGAFTLPVEASYTHTQGQFRTAFTSGFPQFGEVAAGDYLPYVPVHQWYGRVTVAHPKVDLGVGVAGRSEMLDAAGTFPATATDVPALVLVDAGLRVFVNERVTAYANGTNLTGKTTLVSWRPAGARPTAPRQVMAGVEVRGR